jgi:hypothetical protein
MTMKLTRVSAVAAAFAVSVKLPAAETATTDFMVASSVATVATITLAVVTRELVTTSELAAAAKFTEPTVLLIVCAPVVPVAVTVLSRMISPYICVLVLLDAPMHVVLLPMPVAL